MWGGSTTTVTTTTTAGTTTSSAKLVPKVIGEDQARAETILRKAGFQGRVSSVTGRQPGDDFGTPNTVLEQEPSAGSHFAQGETVTLRISLGGS